MWKCGLKLIYTTGTSSLTKTIIVSVGSSFGRLNASKNNQKRRDRPERKVLHFHTFDSFGTVFITTYQNLSEPTVSWHRLLQCY